MSLSNNIRNKISNELTPLAAFGLIAIASIFLFLVLSKLSEATESVKTQFIQTKSELILLQQLPEEVLWDQRLKQSEAAQAVILANLWQGGTTGAIAADVEQSLREMAADMKILSPVVRVDPEAINIDGIDMMYFEVRANVGNAADAIIFLSEVETETRKMLVSSTNLAMSESRQSILRFDGHVPIRIVTRDERP